MSGEFVFTTAKREKITPLIGIFGKSGSGKTLSALKVARGLVGPTGIIAVTDSESRRASHFADDASVAPYHTLDLQPPFTPENYRKSHEAAIAMKAAIHVIDSASHEWTGEGGCLQMVEQFLDKKAGDDWAKRDKFKMAAWAKVSPEHDLFVNTLLRSPIPVICCFRAKDKIVMEKEDSGRTKISTDADAPIARKDLIYEMLMAFECFQEEREGQQSGGYFRIRKPGPPSLHRALLEFKDERLSVKIGQLIASWCAAPIGPGQAPAAGVADGKKEMAILKRELWELTKSKHDEVASPLSTAQLNQWLIDEMILADTETVSEIPLEQLRLVVAKTKAKLAP